MNEHEQRIAIAEACGWGGDGKCIRDVIKRHDEQSQRAYYQDRPLPKGGVPDYFNDLNAMHEAERTLNPSLAAGYARTLTSIAWQSEQPVFAPISATAAQRAEAFLRTIGKWTETNSTKEPTHL
jgi:hypothetical protein